MLNLTGLKCLFYFGLRFTSPPLIYYERVRLKKKRTFSFNTDCWRRFARPYCSVENVLRVDARRTPNAYLESHYSGRIRVDFDELRDFQDAPAVLFTADVHDHGGRRYGSLCAHCDMVLWIRPQHFRTHDSVKSAKNQNGTWNWESFFYGFWKLMV